MAAGEPERLVAAVATEALRGDGEDRALALEVEGGLLLAVADGAGGMPGGALAAELLVAAVARARSEARGRLFDPFFWQETLARADLEILENAAAGETTAAVALLSARGITGASAGDSEAWVISAQGSDDLTADQKKTRLGSGRARPVPFARPALRGTLLLGTDGLFRALTAAEIERTTLALGPSAPRALCLAARSPSGALRDDVTAAVALVAPADRVLALPGEEARIPR